MKRPTERIPRMLDTLTQVWSKYPDMRLGQIVEVACKLATANDKQDMFYVEDDLVERGLRLLLGSSR